MTTSVLLADDQELMRMAFRMVMDTQPDIEIVGEAANGREAVEATRRLAPDVVLMDVRMPEMDGVQATRMIVESHSSARVIILTTFDLDEYVYAALRAGASGFLLKDTPPADLLSGIRAVASGDAVVAPRVTRRLLSTYAHRLPVPGQPDRGQHERLSLLTTREHEVLIEVAAASRMPRSPSASCSRRRPSSRTSGASSRSSSCAIACRSSSSPMRQASSHPRQTPASSGASNEHREHRGRQPARG